MFLGLIETQSDHRTGEYRVILTWWYQIELSEKDKKIDLGGSIEHKTGQPVLQTSRNFVHHCRALINQRRHLYRH